MTDTANNNEQGWPKYLFSITSPDGKKMLVVRNNNREEFSLDVEWAKGNMPQANAFPDDSGPRATPGNMTEAETPKCQVHGSAMKFVPAGVSKKTGKQYSAFYACQEKNADGSFCGKSVNQKVWLEMTNQ